MEGEQNLPDFESELLRRLKTYADKNKQSYSKTVAKIPWHEVTFGEHTADECKARWHHIETRLRTHRTLSELLDDAVNCRWDSRQVATCKRTLFEELGLPSRPMNTFLQFCKDVRDGLKAQYPHKSIDEIQQLISMKYASLTPSTLARYQSQYRQELALWEQQREQFFASHPELVEPVCPRTALQLYMQDTGVQQLLEAELLYKQLDDEQRAIYQRRAEKAERKYRRAVERYQRDVDPTWKPKIVTAKKEDKLKSDLRKPRSVYDLFRSEVWAGIPTDKSFGEKGKLIGEMYRTADPLFIEKLKRQAAQEKEKYEARLEALPEVEREAARLAVRRAASTPRLTGRKLYVREKLPTDTSTLSETEWRRVLQAKFAKLSAEDKAVYERRAAEMNRAAKSVSRPPVKSPPAVTVDELPTVAIKCPLAVTVVRKLTNGSAAAVSVDGTGSCEGSDTTGTDNGHATVVPVARHHSNKRISTANPALAVSIASSAADDVSPAKKGRTVLGVTAAIKEEDSTDDAVSGGFQIFFAKQVDKMEPGLSDKMRRKQGRKAWKDLSEEKRIHYMDKFRRRSRTVPTFR